MSPAYSVNRKESGRMGGVRILGLDFGTKRIGVALSDELAITAQAVCAIERRIPGKDFAEIINFIKENNVTEVVVGLPISMNGSYSAKTKEAAEFADTLAKRIDIPVKTWDERLSTLQAERTLLEADVSRAKRKRVMDKLAAQVILQSYLDSRKD